MLKWAIDLKGSMPFQSTRVMRMAVVKEHVLTAGTKKPLGSMQINELSKLSALPKQSYCDRTHGGDISSGPASSNALSHHGNMVSGDADCVGAFDLDSTALDGRVALLYRGGACPLPSWSNVTASACSLAEHGRPREPTDMVPRSLLRMVLHRQHVHGLLPIDDGVAIYSRRARHES